MVAPPFQTWVLRLIQVGTAIIAAVLGAAAAEGVLRGILAMEVLVSPDPLVAQTVLGVAVEAVAMVTIIPLDRLKVAVVVAALAFLDKALVELRAQQILAGRAEAEGLLVQVGVVLTGGMAETMAAVVGGCLLGLATPEGAQQAQEAVAQFVLFGPEILVPSRLQIQVMFNQGQR